MFSSDKKNSRFNTPEKKPYKKEQKSSNTLKSNEKSNDRFILKSNGINANFFEIDTENSSAFQKSLKQCLSSEKKLQDNNPLNVKYFNIFQDISFDSQQEKFYKAQPEPYCILEAPNLSNNYYYNVLSWSSQNLIGIAIDNIVYTYNPVNNQSNQFIENSQNISSIKYSPNGQQMSVGSTDGFLEIIDMYSSQRIYQVQTHQDRIGCLEFFNNKVFFSGSLDQSVLIHDIRQQNQFQRQNLIFNGKSEITCLKLNNNLLAVGFNDNKLQIYDMRNYQTPYFNKPIQQYNDHKAAVKAICWCPINSNKLISGGGLNDSQIIQWNTFNEQQIDSFDAGSQITNLFFNKNGDQIVSTHGFRGNDIKIWDFNEKKVINQLQPSNERVIFAAMSPDFQQISIASDEKLKFWKIFQNQQDFFQTSQLCSFAQLR